MRFEEMKIEDLGGDGREFGREGAALDERKELRCDAWEGFRLRSRAVMGVMVDMNMWRKEQRRRIGVGRVWELVDGRMRGRRKGEIELIT
jgi:hypothetical protein